MKVYVASNSITLAGKAWEIKRKLGEYSLKHELMIDWINSINHTESRPCLKRLK